MDNSSALIITDIRRPVVIFDTSGLNSLQDDPDRDSKLNLLRGLCHARLTFTAVDEVAATRESYRRSQLVKLVLCIQESGDCFLPFHEVLKNHILAYSQSNRYDWNKVNCEGQQLKGLIRDFRQEFTNELAAEQRVGNKFLESRYKRMFQAMRDNLKEHFEDQGVSWSLEQFLEFAFKAEGSYWKIAGGLMERALTFDSDEIDDRIDYDPHGIAAGSDLRSFTASEAETFAATCPPFKAMLLGLARSQYSRAHDQTLSSDQRSKSAGRVDSYSSVYLPYCRVFVTADLGQFDCLSFVADRLDLGTEVLMYSQFWDRLSGPSFRF